MKKDVTCEHDWGLRNQFHSYINVLDKTEGNVTYNSYTCKKCGEIKTEKEIKK